MIFLLITLAIILIAVAFVISLVNYVQMKRQLKPITTVNYYQRKLRGEL